MILEEPPFKGLRGKRTSYEKKQHIDNGIDTFSIRLNPEERKWLEEAKHILLLDRDSTALKELAEIGKNVIHAYNFDKIIAKVVRRTKRGYADTT